MLCGSLQMALNSSNSIGRPQTELELATTIANFFTKGCTLAEAIDKAKQGGHQYQAHLPTVAIYVQKYAGGPDFPLVRFLSRIGQLYGSTIQLGQDLFHCLTTMDYRVSGELFPFFRMGFWLACVSSGHRATDGFAKALTKSDLEKTRNPSTLQKTKEGESMLANAWSTVQAMLTSGASTEAHLHKCYGKLAVRVVFHICSKEKHSKEKEGWPDLQSILQAFSDEVVQGPGKSQPARPQLTSASGASSSSQEPKVENVLTASVKDLAILQNPHLQVNGL